MARSAALSFPIISVNNEAKAASSTPCDACSAAAARLRRNPSEVSRLSWLSSIAAAAPPPWRPSPSSGSCSRDLVLPCTATILETSGEFPLARAPSAPYAP
eukprot:scaffold79210_cov28-Tisochrysis_lutea.AAC.4